MAEAFRLLVKRVAQVRTALTESDVVGSFDASVGTTRDVKATTSKRLKLPAPELAARMLRSHSGRSYATLFDLVTHRLQGGSVLADALDATLEQAAQEYVDALDAADAWDVSQTVVGPDPVVLLKLGFLREDSAGFPGGADEPGAGQRAKAAFRPALNAALRRDGLDVNLAMFWAGIDQMLAELERVELDIEPERARELQRALMASCVMACLSEAVNYADRFGFALEATPTPRRVPVSSARAAQAPKLAEATVRLRAVMPTGERPFEYAVRDGLHDSWLLTARDAAYLGRDADAWARENGGVAVQTSSDRRISRRHCEISFCSAGWRLRDTGGSGAGSKAGTLLVHADGRPAEFLRGGDGATLKPGDLVSVAPEWEQMGLDRRQAYRWRVGEEGHTFLFEVSA